MSTRTRRLLTTVVTAVLLGAWSPAAAASSGPPADPASSFPGTTPVRAPGEAVADDFDSDYRTALAVVDAYWDTHWDEFFSGTYTAPGMLPGALGPGLYDYPAEQFYCGDQLLTEGNAWYCVPEDFVAFETDLMDEWQRLGDAFVYLVVAHEWAHAVAADFGPSLIDPAHELQADCLAGAAIQGAVDDGLLVLESGDPAEFEASLIAVAGQFPWGTVFLDANGEPQAETHGSAQERVDAFDRGAIGGVPACLPADG